MMVKRCGTPLSWTVSLCEGRILSTRNPVETAKGFYNVTENDTSAPFSPFDHTLVKACAVGVFSSQMLVTHFVKALK